MSANFPRLANIYSKTTPGQNTTACLNLQAACGINALDVWNWASTYVGSSGLNQGQYIKAQNPNQISLMYYHSAGWAPSETGVNNGPIGNVGSTPYAIDNAWFLCYGEGLTSSGASATLAAHADTASHASETLTISAAGNIATNDFIMVSDSGGRNNAEICLVTAGGGTTSLTITRNVMSQGAFTAPAHGSGSWVRPVVFGQGGLLFTNMTANCPTRLPTSALGIADNFTLTSNWAALTASSLPGPASNYAQTAANGTLTITSDGTTTGTAGLQWTTNFNLTGTAVVAKVTPVTNNGSTFTDLMVGSDINNKLIFRVTWNGSAFAVEPIYVVAGGATFLTSTAYDATNHAYWRIREAGGTTFWDASPDGATWTNLASVANPLAVTSVTASLSVGAGAVPGTAFTATLDVGLPLNCVGFTSNLLAQKQSLDANFTNINGWFYDNFFSTLTALTTVGAHSLSNVDLANSNVTAQGGADAAWATAMASLASATRTALPSGSYVVGNTGGTIAAEAANLNGGMAEGINISTSTGAMSSPFSGSEKPGGNGTYNQWDASGHSPSTFFFNASTSEKGTLVLTQTDYQAMRYGLTGCLVQSDGYFNFDDMSFDSSHSDLWWYDEYSVTAAGSAVNPPTPATYATSLGWMGQPIGAATTPSAGVYVRQYSGGLVGQALAICNTTGSTSAAITLPTGLTWKRLSGTQDAATNSGATLGTTVTVPAHDGLLLWGSTIGIVVNGHKKPRALGKGGGTIVLGNILIDTASHDSVTRDPSTT